MTVGEGSRRSSEARESQLFPRLTASSLLTHLQALRRKTIPQSTKSARGCSARLTQASSLWKDTRLNMPNAVWGKKTLQQRQPKGPSPDGVDCSKFTAIAFKMGVTLIAWFFPFDYSLPLRVRGAKCSLQVKNFFFGVYYLMAAYSCWSHALNH